jgi:SAM-dependent methyltransferase
MRVLDVGCGTGDVALLAAKLVGPKGRVIGVDRSGEVLETARARGVGVRGVLEFREQDITTLVVDDELFDAIVGRNVLMHQPDAVATVRRLVGLARPGGLVVFAEPVVLAPPLVAPDDRPLAARCVAWIAQALQGEGLRRDFGLWLHTTFVAAGLPAPTLRLDGVPYGAADVGYSAWLAATVQTLLPLIERRGIATGDEVEIDTLAERLFAEAGAASSTWCGYLQGAAWARVPEHDDSSAPRRRPRATPRRYRWY